MRISDWSSDVCSSDLHRHAIGNQGFVARTMAEVGRDGDHHVVQPRLEYPAQTRQVVPALRVVGHLAAMCSAQARSEEHTSELQSLMRISYAVFCLKKQKHQTQRAKAIPTHAVPQTA